jgi:hypothetical protein
MVFEMLHHTSFVVLIIFRDLLHVLIFINLCYCCLEVQRLLVIKLFLIL